MNKADSQFHDSINNEITQGTISKSIIVLAIAQRLYGSQKLRSIGLYPGQELILMELRENDCQSQNALTKALWVDHSTIAKSVHRLEKAGLVSKSRSEADKRATLISLTEAGKEAGEKAADIWRDMEYTACENLTDDEKKQFLSLTKKIVSSFQKRLNQ
jgi:DNA-binding MarR family transcriptional regulator